MRVKPLVHKGSDHFLLVRVAPMIIVGGYHLEIALGDSIFSPF